MPISPRETMKLKDSEITLIESTQSHIDEQLQLYYCGKTIEIKLEKTLTEKLQKIIKRNYELAGWSFVNIYENKDSEQFISLSEHLPLIKIF